MNIPASTRRVDTAGLRRFNAIIGTAHAASATLMLALSNDFSLDAIGVFASDQPGGAFEPERAEPLFGLPLATVTVGFLYVSAFFHLLVASPLGWEGYRQELDQGRNRFRWVEYSLSSTLMVIAIAMLSGVQDVAALIGIAGANVAMVLFGWLMEMVNPPGRQETWWAPFIMGSVVGAVPWVAITVYLVGAGGDVPGFVYGIFVSIFVFFNCFALNQWLQFRRAGRWADYLFGERVYIWLSITAKSVLAWQVFANTLV